MGKKCRLQMLVQARVGTEGPQVGVTGQKRIGFLETIIRIIRLDENASFVGEVLKVGDQGRLFFRRQSGKGLQNLVVKNLLDRKIEKTSGEKKGQRQMIPRK